MTACPSPHGNPVPDSKVNVTINGNNWTANNVQASEYTNNFGRTFYIRASNVSDKWLSINFFGLTSPGSYPVTYVNNGPTGSGFVMATYYSANGEDPADTGLVTVTNVTSTSVAGSVSFVTKAGVNITNGTFSVSHQ